MGRDAPTLAGNEVDHRVDRPAAPLRVGVVGLGAVAQSVHLPLLAKHPELFRIAAVCDLSASTCSVLGDRFGVDAPHRFATADALLAAADLDAVAILTPGSHGELAAAAARRGLAIFCEKPLAYTQAEADELAALSPRLMLGYMKLYDPAVERARELLADRPSPRSIEVTVLHPPDAPQLAHAGLLPAPDDVDAAQLTALGAAEEAAVRRAVGDVPPELGRLYANVILGSIVHELAVIRYLAGGPVELEYADRWETSIALAGRVGDGTRVSIRWHYLERYPAIRRGGARSRRERKRVRHVPGAVSLVRSGCLASRGGRGQRVGAGERDALDGRGVRAAVARVRGLRDRRRRSARGDLKDARTSRRASAPSRCSLRANSSKSAARPQAFAEELRGGPKRKGRCSVKAKLLAIAVAVLVFVPAAYSASTTKGSAKKANASTTIVVYASGDVNGAEPLAADIYRTSRRRTKASTSSSSSRRTGRTTARRWRASARR